LDIIAVADTGNAVSASRRESFYLGQVTNYAKIIKIDGIVRPSGISKNGVLILVTTQNTKKLDKLNHLTRGQICPRAQWSISQHQ
jgi:hypothetical protein